MILMFHHVSPREQVPPWKERSALEGWDYTMDPATFDLQLRYLLERGYRFLSFGDYVELCRRTRVDARTVTVTFDDGWADFVDFAMPVLQDHQIPACVFVVSGPMQGVSANRRMDDSQLRAISAQGVTVGAHSVSHANLASLTAEELESEVRTCRESLGERLGRSIQYFAYPGGRFNQRVVQATLDAGYDAACSVIAGGINGPKSLFWLYRETFFGNMSSLRDRIFLARGGRKVLDFRARARVKRMLAT